MPEHIEQFKVLVQDDRRNRTILFTLTEYRSYKYTAQG